MPCGISLVHAYAIPWSRSWAGGALLVMKHSALVMRYPAALMWVSVAILIRKVRVINPDY
jgi:hypothetical protein